MPLLCNASDFLTLSTSLSLSLSFFVPRSISPSVSLPPFLPHPPSKHGKVCVRFHLRGRPAHHGQRRGPPHPPPPDTAQVGEPERLLPEGPRGVEVAHRPVLHPGATDGGHFPRDHVPRGLGNGFSNQLRRCGGHGPAGASREGPLRSVWVGEVMKREGGEDSKLRKQKKSGESLAPTGVVRGS